MSDPSPNAFTSTLLLELAGLLRSTDHEGCTAWLDVGDRRIELLTFDPMTDLGPRAADAPAWRQDEHRLAARIREQTDRYERIPAMGSPGRLHDFIHGVDDPDLREQLWDAVRGGRGAYRRVRELLHRRGLEQQWQDFERAADLALARDWLRSVGLLPEAPQVHEHATDAPEPA